MTEHLRLNGVYWGLCALCLLGKPEVLDRDEMIKYVLSCQTEEGERLPDTELRTGGFGAHTGHDAHLIYTCSAVQILAIQNALDVLDAEKVIQCTSYIYSADPRRKITTKQRDRGIRRRYNLRRIRHPLHLLLLPNPRNPQSTRPS